MNQLLIKITLCLVFSFSYFAPIYSDNVEKIKTAQANFAYNMLKQMGDDQGAGNGLAVYSPLSLVTALAISANGARNETLRQLETVLTGGAPIKDLANYLKTVLASAKSKKGIEVKSANRIIYAERMDIHSEYVTLVKRVFECDVQQRNISRANADALTAELNAWASEATNGKITDAFSPKKFNSQLMVLVNAVYFKGAWQVPFEAQFKNVFYASNGQQFEVDYIEQKAYYRYVINDQMRVALMPYLNDDYEMMIVVPQNETLKKLEERMHGTMFAELSKKASNDSEISVTMPKFQIKNSIGMVDMLKTLGIQDAFEFGKADFSGLTDSMSSIGDVFQTALIEVDEKGTTAAAVTSIDQIDGHTPQPLSVKADRSFLFAVINKNYPEIPLFAGRFDPQSV